MYSTDGACITRSLSGLCLSVISLILCLGLSANLAFAATTSDVANTKHNLSASGPGTVRASSESELCVFCHTPHGANTSAQGPLWNRSLSSATYQHYTSESVNAPELSGAVGWSVDNSSKLCLSCHDGTLAIGQVANAPGSGLGSDIDMTGTAAGGTMPEGEGLTTGFTRNLGTDLSNDHPISFTYDSALASADGELRDPVSESHIGTRTPGDHPVIPLDQDGKLTCVSCHDPHVRDATDLAKNIKFLRLNRFQEGTPAGGAFSESSDTVCLACHDKLGLAWAQSAHASPTVADETYKSGPGSAAELRDFPADLPVWKAACLNCHDTHTVQGSRRLLREGVEPGTNLSARPGGTSAIEETCYQCHTTAAKSVIQPATGTVPDIETDYTTPGWRHMPITDAEQRGSGERHAIVDADFLECQKNLGASTQGGPDTDACAGLVGSNDHRHAECTDCHNPHRVVRNNLFNGTGTLTTQATHDPDTPTNIASGALRGAWGVEPTYISNSFHVAPTTFEVKKGDGGIGASTAVASPWVTREYQICLKCHSYYAYGNEAANAPYLGATSGSGGGTPAGTNGLIRYTDQAREFNSPNSHRGELNVDGSLGTDGGATYNARNHRSWHPVMNSTGRDAATRSVGTGNSSPWEEPWRANLGNQTMYCTDCHGSNASGAGDRLPDTGKAWGPHGSQNDFILKGTWDENSGSASTTTTLCFKCHRADTYPVDGGQNTGFRGGGKGDLHSYHRDKIGSMECTWCHVAVPHGWKNKAFLVNLNDVNVAEGADSSGEVCTGSGGFGTGDRRGGTGCGMNNGYTLAPYYLDAFLKVITFQRSGNNWSEGSCGSASGDTGRDWMRDQACDSPN